MTTPRLITASERQQALLWLLGFLLVQTICQVALLVPTLAPLRVGFRIAAFAISLIALLLVPGRSVSTPAVPWLLGCVLVLTLAIFHPSTNSPLAGLAQLVLYLAILAPIIWVTRLRLDSRVFLVLIGYLCFFHSLSASVGVMQTLYPGRFEMSVASSYQQTGSEDGFKITLADGSTIFRPTGLTDAPGGAASAGFLAYLFGLGFLSTSRSWIVHLVSTIALGLGLYCIYLSQVRVFVVLTVIGTLVFCLGLTLLARLNYLWRLLIFMPLVVTVSTVGAFTIGGEATVNRLSTLVEESPTDVYGKNRGRFLEVTFSDYLPQYPLGAGLGRWGMTRNYFGDESNLESTPIWVEIQLTAWVIDGGFPLLMLYSIAVLLAIGYTLRLAWRCPDPWLSTWGLLVVGYDVAILATLFSYVPFIGQMGQEFWLFNAAYWMTIRSHSTRAGTAS